MWLNNYEWHLDYIRLAKDSSFSFEKTKFPLDKNKFCMLDVDKIIEDRNVGIIEQFLPSIIQYNIDTNEHIGIIDQNFLKLFRMSQLAVEYLLFCKKYLDHTVILLKEEIRDVKLENHELRIFNDELKQHTDTLLEKLKKKDEMIATFKCNKCSKAFSTEAYLSAHIERRHTNKPTENFGLDIEMEIKEIKEKLNNTEKLIKNEELNPKIEDTLNKNYTKVSELLLKFDSLRSQVENDFKMLHTQKDFEEKYLKMFQSALENVKIHINKELGIPSSPYKFQEKRNSITQTDSDVIITSEKNIQANEIPTPQVEPPEQKLEEVQFQKLEDQMKNACENISNTMGSSLKNIEVQMQALWDKLQELESKKTIVSRSQDVNENVENMGVYELTVSKPKLRKRYSSKLENKSNKTSEPSLMSEENKVEGDVIRPSSDTRYDTLDDAEEKDEITVINSKISEVKSLKSPASSKSKTTFEDLDRIDVLDEVEPSKAITVVKSVNSLYETEDIESDEDESLISSETEPSEDMNPKELPSKDLVLHVEKSGSTLGKRSISSLKRASVSTSVVEKLKKEMEKVLNDRLSVLGISSDWKGIPQQTYSRVMDILNHQAKLVQKSVPDYKNIRKEILTKVEQEFQSKRATRSIGVQKKTKKNLKGILSQRSLNNKNNSFRMRKHQSVPEVEIKNRKMYESESSSGDEDKNRNLRRSVSTIIHRTPHYSAVIEELKKSQISEDDNLPDNNLDKMDLQMKSVLKNFPKPGPVPKKRVLFDLKSQETDIPKPVIRDAGGGSTTSVASSVLDLSDDSPQKTEEKGKLDLELDIEDFSDSDFSIFDTEGKIVNKGDESKK